VFANHFTATKFVLVLLNLSANKSYCKIQWNAFKMDSSEIMVLLINLTSKNLPNLNQIINTEHTEEMVQWII